MRDLVLVLVITLIFFSCRKDNSPRVEANACFSYSQVDSSVLNELKFQSCSKNGTKYEWEFGDGTFSNEVNPTHVFENDSNFLVKLKVYDAKNNASTYSQNVHIKAKYITSFTVMNASQEDFSWSEYYFNYAFPPNVIKSLILNKLKCPYTVSLNYKLKSHSDNKVTLKFRDPMSCGFENSYHFSTEKLPPVWIVEDFFGKVEIHTDVK